MEPMVWELFFYSVSITTLPPVSFVISHAGILTKFLGKRVFPAPSTACCSWHRRFISVTLLVTFGQFVSSIKKITLISAEIIYFACSLVAHRGISRLMNQFIVCFSGGWHLMSGPLSLSWPLAESKAVKSKPPRQTEYPLPPHPHTETFWTKSTFSSPFLQCFQMSPSSKGEPVHSPDITWHRFSVLFLIKFSCPSKGKCSSPIFSWLLRISSPHTSTLTKF